jgi:hypothetical protein
MRTAWDRPEEVIKRFETLHQALIDGSTPTNWLRSFIQGPDAIQQHLNVFNIACPLEAI